MDLDGLGVDLWTRLDISENSFKFLLTLFVRDSAT